MAIHVVKTSSVTAQFSNPQEIIVSDADDSIKLGDGAGNYAQVENGAVKVKIIDDSVMQQAGLNSFQTSQYVVGTAPIQITPTALAGRSSISLRVDADTKIPVYIGNDSSVSTSTGYPLYDGDTLSMDLTPDDTIFAISTEPGQTIAVLELA